MSEFAVWSVENDIIDARKFDCFDAEMAAEEWAKHDDQRSAEYSIARGNEAIVNVQDIESGVVEQYSVTGEAVPVYSANKVPG